MTEKEARAAIKVIEGAYHKLGDEKVMVYVSVFRRFRNFELLLKAVENLIHSEKRNASFAPTASEVAVEYNALEKEIFAKKPKDLPSYCETCGGTGVILLSIGSGQNGYTTAVQCECENGGRRWPNLPSLAYFGIAAPENVRGVMLKGKEVLQYEEIPFKPDEMFEGTVMFPCSRCQKRYPVAYPDATSIKLIAECYDNSVKLCDECYREAGARAGFWK